MHIFVVKKLDLIGWLEKKSILYHDVSHKQVASVGILLRSIWMCEKACKISGLSPNALYNISGFSLSPKHDCHHITEKSIQE
jgi:hypothetical protein